MKYRIILLPQPAQSKQLRVFSETIQSHGDGYRLDAHHLPHVTVVAFEGETVSVAREYWERVRRLELTMAHVQVHHLHHYTTDEFQGYILLHLLSSDSLRAIYRSVKEALSEDIKPRDFRKYSVRPPHLTLGVDPATAIHLPELRMRTIQFDRIALAESAEFGSVESLLHERQLAKAE